MDSFTKKTITTTRGYTYTYYTSYLNTDHENKSTPALLFHHGWPDHAQMYASVITHLRAHNITHPIIVPDMLGYAGTSKPSDPAAYKFDGLAQDMLELIDAEHFASVVAIGHDWGSAFAQRLYQYHPARVVGLVMLNVAYRTLHHERFDLDAVNARTAQIFGYPIFAYWSLFGAAEAPKILRENVGRLYSVLHAAGADPMRRFFCVPGAMKAYLLSEEPEVEVRAYAQDPAFKEAFINRLATDGFEGPQQWYVATLDNFNFECDRVVPIERNRVAVPALYIGCTEDAVCRPEIMGLAKQAGFLPDLEERMVQAGHWGVYERPAEVAGYMADWLGRRFKAQGGGVEEGGKARI